MDKVTLTKAWGRYRKGATLRVLEPGEEPAEGTVDQRRAAKLVADGFAEQPGPPKEPEPPKPATARSGRED